MDTLQQYIEYSLSIFFIMQVVTHETVSTIVTVVQIWTIYTLWAQHRPKQLRRSDTIHTLISDCIFISICTICAIIHIEDMFSIVHILTKCHFKTHITILRNAGWIRIITIFLLNKLLYQWIFRHRLKEILKLCSKRLLFIVRYTVYHRIPWVAPSKMLLIDWQFFISRIHAYYTLSCRITLSLVELPFVSKKESPSLSFFGTKRRPRNKVLLPCKRRTHLLIKRIIWCINRKFSSAHSTCSSLDNWIIHFFTHILIDFTRSVLHIDIG